MTPRPLNQMIETFLARLPESAQLDFFGLLETLDATRFTGPVTFDFLNGKPRQINLGAPVKLTICEGLPSPGPAAGGPGGLDKPRKPTAG